MARLKMLENFKRNLIFAFAILMSRCTFYIFYVAKEDDYIYALWNSRERNRTDVASYGLI